MALLLFFFFLLASATMSTTADLTIPAIYKTCTSQTLQDPTTKITLDTLFTTLVAASNLTNFFQTTVATTATTVNGLYQCRADLSQSDCKTCVQKLTNIIITPCKTATAQFAGCYMTYEVVGNYISYSDGGEDYGGCTSPFVALVVAIAVFMLLQARTST